MLVVNLLGDIRFSQDGVAVPCRARKSLALLAFLLLDGGRNSRRDLARLLWGASDDAAARTSLRTALQRLPPALARHLDSDHEHIGLKSGIARDIDSERFTELARAQDIDSLERAAALYAGELLHDLEVDATAEFDDWLLRQRTRFRQTAQSVFDRLIARHRERALSDQARAGIEREAAMTAARRWLAVEPAAEDAHRWLMLLFLDAGLHDSARAQYEACRRELAVATGRLPTEQTRAVIDAVAGLGEPTPSGRASGHGEPGAIGIPLPLTSFVGRSQELAEIQGLLADPQARLITLHGLGGSGKSRLAAAAARQFASQFPHGACWVALDEPGTDLVEAIARALGLDLPAPPDRMKALVGQLRAQRRLLVLDNFETFLSGEDRSAVDVVLALLQQAPGLRLLVTSRTVLAIQEEWVIETGGLATPPAEAENAPMSQHHDWSAIELFAQRARQAHRGFSLQSEWREVVRLCRYVDGLPLALELTAAWVRTVPCVELLRMLTNEAARLSSPHRDRAPRHASLDAVVSSSWNWLASPQQAALAALSSFVGAFAHAAAAEVSGATLSTISALIDKSLVQRLPDGRLALHTLVRQFAAARLAQSDRERSAVAQRYAEYFAHRLQRWRARFAGPLELQADLELTQELPDLRQAVALWRAEGRLAQLAESWLMALQTRGLHRDVLDAAQSAFACGAADDPVARGRLQNLQARSLTMCGQVQASRAAFDAAAEIGRQHGDRELLASALVHGAGSWLVHEDMEQALARLDQAQAALEQCADPALPFTATHLRGLVLYSGGQLPQAQRQLREAVELAQRAGSPRMQALAATSLATVLVLQGQAAEAQLLLAKAQPIYERSGNWQYLARVHNVRASAWLAEDDPVHATAAIDSARQAVKLYELCGRPILALAATQTLGRALAVSGALAEAHACFAAAADAPSPTLAAESRLHLVRLAAAAGEPAEARRQAGALLELEARTGHAVARRCLLLAGAVLAAAEWRAAAAEPELASRRAWWLEVLLADPRADALMRRMALALRPPAADHAARPTPGSDALADVRDWLGAQQGS